MFLKQFNGTQKKAFLALADKLAMADGKLAKEEEALIKSMCEEMNYDPCTIMKGVELPQLLTPFDTRESQVCLLVELIGLEYADDDYSHQENELMGTILEHYGFTQNDLLEMENWVFRCRELVNELKKFY